VLQVKYEYDLRYNNKEKEYMKKEMFANLMMELPLPLCDFL